MDNTTENTNISYNAAIKEIEDILKEMQSENCDIDRLAENTRRAAQLIELCRSKLLRTEEEIQKALSPVDTQD